MRHYIYLLLVLLVGCRQQDLNISGEQSVHLLEFNTSVQQSESHLTRAYPGDIKIRDTGFTVVGYMTRGVFSLADNTALPIPNVFNFKNQALTPLKTLAINAKNKYQVDLPEITHDEGTNVSYFAWAQSAGSDGITATTINSSQTGYPWLDVTVPLPNVTQRDVVAATSMNLSNEYVVSAVDLDFKHILSKLSFKIKAPEGATATIVSTTCSFGTNKVYQKGRFAFNNTDSVGSWGAFNTYLGSNELTPSGWSTPTLTLGNTSPLGEMLLLPQKVTDGFLTLKVTYTLTMGGVASSQQTRTLSLKAIDLLRGDNYLYTLLLNADEMTLFNVTIAPWIEGETGMLPLVPGPKGDVILLLDGNEEPYTHTDGKQYWLDASGWNNHCLIDNSATTTNQITYNRDQKGYVFDSQSVGVGLSLSNVVRVPNLGALNGTFSCEMVANLNSNASSYIMPFYFSSDDLGGTLLNKKRLFSSEIYANKFIYDFGATTTAWSTGQRVDIPIYSNRASQSFYAFTRSSSGRQTITYNDQYHNDEYSAVSANNKSDFTNGVIGPLWKGTINYIKISKNQLSRAQIATDYTELKEKFKITTDAGFVPPPPITRGLMLCLDGRSALVSSKWKDLSARGNDATIHSANSGITYRADRKMYSIKNYTNAGSNYIYVANVGDCRNAYTVEFAAEDIGKAAPQSVLFHFTGSVGSGVRAFFVHYPYNSRIYIDSPESGSRYDALCYESGGVMDIYRVGGEHFSVTRAQGSNMFVYKGGTRIGSTGTPNTITAFNACYIGRASHNNEGVDAYLYFVRVYNRVLTNAERQLNLTEDKKVYNVIWN